MMILTIRSNPKSSGADVGVTVAPQGYQSKI